jgi:hypothetical protein
MKKIIVLVFALSLISSLAFAIQIPQWGDSNNSDSSSSGSSINYRSAPAYTPLETTSDRNARHDSEEYQARQEASPYQINAHRASPLGDATTREDMRRYDQRSGE